MAIADTLVNRTRAQARWRRRHAGVRASCGLVAAAGLVAALVGCHGPSSDVETTIPVRCTRWTIIDGQTTVGSWDSSVTVSITAPAWTDAGEPRLPAQVNAMVPDPDTGPLDATMIGELWVTGASDPIGISLVPSSGLPDYGSPFVARLSVPQRGTGSFEIGLSDLSTYTDLGGAAGNQTYASCKPTDGAGVVDRIDVRGWPVP